MPEPTAIAEKLDANFLIVSNGLEHFFCKMDTENECYIFLENIPNYLDV